MASFKGYSRKITLNFDYNEIKEGVPNVRKQMAILNAEFKKSSAEAEASGKEIEKLGTRYDYLGNRLKIQEKEVENYRKKLEDATNAKGNNTKAIENNTTSLQIAEAKLAQTKAELSKVTKEMEYQQNIIDKNSEEWKDLEYQLELISAEYSKAGAEAKKSGKIVNELSAEHKNLSDTLRIQERQVEMFRDKLKEATSAENKNEQAIRENTLELARAEAQLAQTKAELDKVTKELEKQKLTLGKTAEEWKDLSEKANDIGKSLTMKVTVPIMAAGTAAFKMAADYEQSLGKMGVVFEHNSKSIERWAQNSLRDFGLARSTAIGMAGDFGALFKGVGINLQKTEEWSKTLTERTMDLANFYDYTVEETINSLNAIVTGQTEPLRKFGINMTQATLQEYALSKGIRKKIADMTEAEKVQLRYNYVIDKTNIAVGTTARESDSATGQMNRLKEITKELGESFGTILLPAIIPIFEWMNNVLEAINNLDEGSKKFILKILGIAAAIGPLLILLVRVFDGFTKISGGIEALSKITTAFNNLLDNQVFLKFAKWAALIALVVGLIYLLISAINDARGVASSASKTFENMGNIVGNVQSSVNNVGKIPGYSRGTNFHPGGLAIVGEQGPELLNLPRGSQVYTNSETKDMLSSGETFNLTLNVNMDEVDDVSKLVRIAKEFKQTKRAGIVRG